MLICAYVLSVWLTKLNLISVENSDDIHVFWIRGIDQTDVGIRKQKSMMKFNDIFVYYYMQYTMH